MLDNQNKTIFLQDTMAHNDAPSHKVWLQKKFCCDLDHSRAIFSTSKKGWPQKDHKYRRYNSHTLIISALTLTTATIKKKKKIFFYRTLVHDNIITMPILFKKVSTYQKISSGKTVTEFLSVWASISTGHFGLWWSTIKLSFVAKNNNH